LHVGCKFMLDGRIGIGNNRQQREVNVRQAVGKSMAPRAHTASVEGISTLCREQNGNWLSLVQGDGLLAMESRT
jgi:hypothetical protein